MNTAPSSGTQLASRRYWLGYLWTLFWVAFVYIPWHFGVFFGQRIECINFPRDWILHAFAVLGYIQAAAIVVVIKTQSIHDRYGSIAFISALTALVITLLMTIWYWEKCL